MLNDVANALGVSGTVAVVLGVLALLQLSLQVMALVDLARRTAVKGGKKWVWAVIAVLGGLVGAVVYLAVGPAETLHPEPSGSAEGTDDTAARRAVDALYGGPREPGA